MESAYQQALDYLYDFINFEHHRMDRYTADKISLARPAELLSRLGNPHDAYASIHIAGTKGKGSVAAMCSSCLRFAGLRVGLYTSPHLQDFRDRIRVLTPGDQDGRISQRRVVQLTERMKGIVEDIPSLTWYEVITAMAFTYFAESQVDIAVVEVGLGGRLDATNVLNPLVSVITSLSLDHTLLLGDTLGEIAAEKGGIIKSGVPVVTAPQESDALAQLTRISTMRGAPLTIVGREWEYDRSQEPSLSEEDPYIWRRQVTVIQAPDTSFVKPPARFELNLTGRHQQENAVVALATLNEAWGRFPGLDIESVRAGFAQVEWPGRFQLLSNGGLTLLLDCAHNVNSTEKLAQALINDLKYEHLYLILGISSDKDIQGIIRTLLPLTDRAVLTESSHPRAAKPEDLERFASELGYQLQTSKTVEDALDVVRLSATAEDLVCVTGSIFVVADLLNEWDSLQSQRESIGSAAVPRGDRDGS